ncbi:amino acid permease [Stygiolobus azoricus]|uniref:Amino acid permease n=1 Tax=Stygiolobus azoricus TaxID=41675 RepID=A0A650CP64_9CREN|nr:amino acid permease [Stygiolobus azoricus]QGR19630.1 amino acid permease [Stygiolobus azoricus]
MEKRGPFLRESSGLVREFSILDAMWFNISLLGFLFSMYYVASTSPLVGGNPIIGAILPTIGFFFVGYTFSYIGSKVPRTAADYVYVSRYLHPALGFVGNAGYFAATVFMFMGISGITLQTFGLIPLLDMLGFYSHNQSLIQLGATIGSNPYYIILIGGIEIILMGLVPLFGNKVYRVTQAVIIPLVLIAAIVMIIIEAIVPSNIATTRLNEFLSYYNSSVSQILASNVTVPSFTSLYNSISLNPVYVVAFSYIINTVYIAGEVKNVKKSLWTSILGTLVISSVLMTLSVILEYNQWSYNLISKIMSLSVSGQFSAPTPYLDLLEGIASGNEFIAAFLALISLIQLLMYLIAASFVGSRLLLSYSIDRILPNFVSEVSERTHVPKYAVLLSTITGLIGLIIFGLPVTSAFAFVLSSIAVALLLLFPMTVVSIAVIKKSKEAIPRLFAGISIPYLLFTLYQYLTVPALGANTVLGYALLVGTIVFLLAIFYISKFIRKKQGIDLNLIFKEIPPE